MLLETQRLILRPWQEDDAESLFLYASDDDVGPIAGWPSHKSVAESRAVIQNVFSGSECYAVCIKPDRKAVGCIELKLNGYTDFTKHDDECEMGFWLGKPFWGNGFIPEAAQELLRRGFEELGMKKIWCAYYAGNEKSKRAQEKIGFRFSHISKNVDVPLLNETRDDVVNSITKDEWIWTKMLKAAQSVQNARTISDYVEAGGVAAAVLSSTGKIYTGICVDTCSTLGICAERNAIFNMLTCGEQKIQKVLAIMPDGRSGAPCGACRELMVQLMPDGRYKNIEIMMDFATMHTITLGELTPEWWIK